MKKETQNIFRKIYKWHKFIGLITVIPVIFWTLSGFMHPFLSHWFKPTIPREFMIPSVIDKSQLKVSLHQVLVNHDIDDFKKLRLVQFNDSTFYQVKQSNDELS